MEKHILLIGIGSTGCNIADTVSGKMNKAGLDTTTLCVTTDKGDASDFGYSRTISMASQENFMEITERLGAECVSHWLPSDVLDADFTRNFSAKMDDGAGSWRAKAMLLFLSYVSQPQTREELDSELSAFCERCAEDDEIEIYTVADIGDGTGSGLLVPFALYVKRFIKATVANKIRSTAMVIGAGAYSEDQTCEELYVKAYANMYACMRELHAINLAAHSSEEGDSDMSPISIRLGGENDPVGVLFDSCDPEFCVPDAKPFSKVCFFDRVPGVKEGSPYETMLSNILYTVCSGSFELDYNDRLSSKTVDAIYSGIAMRSVSYPEDSIASFLSRKSLISEIYEWYELHENTKSTAKKNILAKQKRVIPEEELFLEYRDSFIKALDQKYKDNERDDITADDRDRVQRYIIDLDKMISGYITVPEGEIYSFMNEKIPSKRDPEYKSYKKPSYFDRKKRLHKIAADVTPYFESWFADGIQAYNARKEEFVAGILAGELSIEENVIKEEGNFTSPLRAMYALCRLHKWLEERLGYSMRIPKCELRRDDGKYDCPLKLFMLTHSKDDNRACSKYIKQGNDRFLRLFEGYKINIGGSETDAAILKGDIRDVYANFYNAFWAEWMQEVLTCIRREIDRYYAMLDYMRHVVFDWSDEVDTISEHISSVSFPAAKIRVSAADVKNAYSLYDAERREGLNDKERFEERYLGQAFFEISRDATFNEDGDAKVSRAQLSELWRRGCERSEELIYGESFFKNHLSKNILDAIMCPDRECFPSQNMADQLSLLFAPLYSPFRVDATVFRKIDSIVGTHTDFIFPTSAKDSAQRLIDRGEADARSAEELIRDIVIRGGAYEGNVTFSDNIDAKSVIVCCETTGLRLNCIEQLNEMSKEAKGYTLYKEALSRQESFESIVWGPHISYSFNVCGSLPYINPVKQRIYETEICGALAYAKIYDVLGLTQNRQGEMVYSFITKNGPELLRWNGEPIGENEYDKLILWLSQNPDKQRKWYSQYSEMLRSECSRLPITGCFGSLNLAPICSVIRSSKLIVGLCELMMPVVNAIRHNDSSVCGAVFAERFARTCYEALTCLCSSRYQMGEDNYTEVYMYSLRLFGASALSQSEKAATELFEWLASLGMFRAFIENNDTCAYDPAKDRRLQK